MAIAGAANNNDQYLYYDTAIPANDTFVATIGLTLGAADVIRVYATLATLTFQVHGVEIS